MQTEVASTIAPGATESTAVSHGHSRAGRVRACQSKASGKRILVVEGDTALAGFLSAELETLQFGVDQIHDGEEALHALQARRRYDLVILDLNPPKLDGIGILKQVRPYHPRLPVLVLTARAGVEARVHALERGADDCLTKPFSLLELIARVHALLRRNSGFVSNCSTVGDLTMYRDERLVERNGRRIELTPREYSILDVMMQNLGRPVSRALLLDEVWNTAAESSTNIVDVYMKYLRDKIDLPGEARLTHTVRGFGYELRAI